MAIPDLQRRLTPGERLLWSGAPSPGLVLFARDIFLIPFSLLWLGFVIVWLFGVWNTEAPIFFYLFGGAFLIIGLMFAFGRFVIDAGIRSSTSYGVTDQRILIVRGGQFSKFTSLSLKNIPDINISGENRRRGTIRFGNSWSVFGQNGFGIWVPSLDPTPQFLAIENARYVFDVIMQASRRG